ncbi:MAG: transposase [Dehalococcoidales bacterium]|nr:transposase [Dehalococcoidales bacterium]
MRSFGPAPANASFTAAATPSATRGFTPRFLNSSTSRAVSTDLEWRETFKDLKRRGLDSQTVTSGIMDSLPGLEKVFREEFPQGKVQRWQVHVARNVLAKVPQKLKQKVADDIRSIFYASSRDFSR